MLRQKRAALGVHTSSAIPQPPSSLIPLVRLIDEIGSELKGKPLAPVERMREFDRRFRPESNLGTAAEPDGSITVRMIAEQSAFVPDCVRVPVNAPVKIRRPMAEN
jgi:hypothetical protein